MNTYKFDWDVVATQCPEYKKYLIPLRDHQRMQEDKRLIEMATAPPEYEEYRLKNKTEEELAVIKEMHDGTAPKPNDPAAFWNETRVVAVNKELDKLVLNPKYERSSNLLTKINPLQLLPPKCVLGVGSKLKFYNNVGWGLMYLISDNGNSDGSVDLLKTKVAEHEEKIKLISAAYWFNQHKDVMSDRKGLFHCLTYNKKTRNLYHTRRELKLDYSIINKALLCKKKARRYKSVVRGILLSMEEISKALINVDVSLVSTFIDLVEKSVIADVPDAYIPTKESNDPQCNSQPRPLLNLGIGTALRDKHYLIYKLIVLLVQHKANTRIDWLTKPLIYNLHQLLQSANFDEFIEDGSTKDTEILDSEAYNKKIVAKRKKRVGKVIPTLRKSPSLTKLVKAVFDKYYFKLQVKLLQLEQVHEHTLLQITKSMYHDRLPKYMYHWLNDLIKTVPNPTAHSVINSIFGVIMDLNSRNLPNNVLESWVKTTKRLFNQLGPSYRDLSWGRWKDMYNMADMLHIRIRPNKFKTPNDVKELHDKLSVLTTRDKRSITKYAHTIFLLFEAPDKEYDGFKFIQLHTANELIHEGTTMHHCVGSYSPQCVKGDSIIFSMRKDGRSYVTIELNGAFMPYIIRQKYTIGDVTVTSKTATDIIDRWLEDVRELHKDDTETYSAKCTKMYRVTAIMDRLKALDEIANGAEEDILRSVQKERETLQIELELLEQTDQESVSDEEEYEDELDVDFMDLVEDLSDQVEVLKAEVNNNA